MQPVLLFALEGDARAVHLRHTEAVVSLHAHQLLDALPLFLGVRFGADAEGVQMRVAPRVDAHFIHHFRQARCVARDDVQAGRPEVGDKLDLPLRVSCGRRHGQATQLLGSVLESQSAGEHAVARGVLENVRVPYADHVHAAGHLIGPLVEVAGRMEHDGRITRCAARRMEPHALLQRDGHHAERIIAAQVVFCGERDFLQILQRTDAVCRDAILFKHFAIKRGVPRNLDCLLQPFQLELLQVGALHGLNFFLPIFHCFCFHHVYLNS